MSYLDYINTRYMHEQGQVEYITDRQVPLISDSDQTVLDFNWKV